VIPLTRGAVRSFLAVARRASPNGRRAGPDPPVRIAAGADAVTLAVHYGSVVLGCRCPAVSDAGEEFVVPLTDLRALDGRGDGPIELAQTAPDVVSARWTDEAGSHETAIPILPDSPLVWPAEPRKVWPVTPGLPTALHEAGKTAAREAPGRYATDHVQVRGKAGQVIGTDGKQALTIGGFSFSFSDDLVVPAVPVFGYKDLGREPMARSGLDKDWLFLGLGPWRVWLRINHQARFPDVAGVVPKAVTARVTFADADAERLMAELSRLPGGTEDVNPITLDVDAGRVTVRGRDDETKRTAAVRLRDSTGTGPPTRLVLNRRHLGRALAVGCRELTVSGAGKPLAFRGPDRVYLSVPLGPESPVPSSGPADDSVLPSSPESDRRVSMLAREVSPVEKNGHVDSPAPVADGFDPLAEAEDLKVALADAAGRAARLVAALKSYRRERKSLQAAWSSLRALNLGP
jgi:hypothetical protein